MIVAVSSAGIAAETNRRIVVLVWDGMRRDFISAETTPNLWTLGESGVLFANHHQVYPSSTEMNGTAIATGAYPGRSTIVGNNGFRPRIDPQKSVGTEKPDVVARGDALAGGKHLTLETVAELLQARGMRTAIAGAKQVALLHDRRPRSGGAPLHTPAVMTVVSEAAPIDF